MNRAELRLAPQDKLVLHRQFTDYLGGKKIYPINVEISPNGTCQASCAFCFYANTGELGAHRKVFLKYPTLFSVIRECYVMGIKSISWTGGGEPSLYPHIADAIETAHFYGIEQGMFTNALAMPKYDPNMLSWIRVTMTDKPYRPDVIKVLRNCKTLGFAFNYAGPQDDGYLLTTLELAERVKADYVQLRPALRFHGETVDITPPDIDHPLLHVTHYKFEDAKHRHGYRHCEGYHFSPFIWEDGNVDVCSYMRKHEGYTLGNIYKNSLKDILDKAPDSVRVHPQCQVCCRLHETNKRIHVSRMVEDKNFP